MTIKPLTHTPLDQIIDCFLLAFDNYFVKMPTDKAYYIERWKAANVDFSLSYGMFDKDKLVGFILHAVDTRFGILTAYNTGTGVIPAYRGQRIVQSIYLYALVDLKTYGIKKSTLEVITENEKALKAYKAIGFKVSKTYKCFNGDIRINPLTTFETEQIDIQNIDWKHLPDQHDYSWDNQKETIVKGDYTFYYVLNNKERESYFIIKPDRNYIAQCGVLKSGDKSWNRLFSAIKSMSDTMKINNVDSRLKEKLKGFSTIGLTHVADQYEMELSFE